MQKPTPGRIVRFLDSDGETTWPAIVTLVHDETTVSLQVFRQAGIEAVTSVPFMVRGAGQRFTWDWPDRS